MSVIKFKQNPRKKNPTFNGKQLTDFESMLMQVVMQQQQLLTAFSQSEILLQKLINSNHALLEDTGELKTKNYVHQKALSAGLRKMDNLKNLINKKGFK